MLAIASIISILYIEFSRASFLQCSPSDSLESLDELSASADYAEKRGVVCAKWPFYSGGFAMEPRDSSDDSSEEDTASLLFPATIDSDSIVYDFQDKVQVSQCVESVNTRCTKWIVTSQEAIEQDDKSYGCGSKHDSDSDEAEISLFTEYQLCLCADVEIDIDLTATQAPITSYCTSWACLETASYPADYSAYSLITDNDFLYSSSWSSSSDSSDSSDDDDEYNGDYYRFVKDGTVMELDESMEFMNCWCQETSLNEAFCLNWYCESLEHDEYGCHKEGFGVDDYGWFGCFDDGSTDNALCMQWYGFLVDDESRDEYRCECLDDTCLSWVCGANEIPLRQNYIWYNFPLAMILWVCLCGCCGTKMCFKKREGWNRCFKFLQCRKCRMFIFYLLFGAIAMIHGGFPAFLFFTLSFSMCSWCAYKCENCKCCEKKWECKYSKKCGDTEAVEFGRTDTKTNDRDGENSKEESVSDNEDKPKTNKTGHIRVNSVDIDDIDGDENIDGPQI